MSVFVIEVIEEKDLVHVLDVISRVRVHHRLGTDLRRNHLIVKIKKIVISAIN